MGIKLDLFRNFASARVKWKLAAVFSVTAVLISAMVVMAITSQSGIKLNTAAATPSTDFKFAAAGDFGAQSGGDWDRLVFAAMQTKTPEIVVGLGDYSYQDVMYSWHTTDLYNNYRSIHDAMHNAATGFKTVALGNHEDGSGVP